VIKPIIFDDQYSIIHSSLAFIMFLESYKSRRASWIIRAILGTIRLLATPTTSSLRQQRNLQLLKWRRIPAAATTTNRFQQ
jgi:hypothetical protein